MRLTYGGDEDDTDEGDGDTLLEEFRDRVDAGEQCPECYYRGKYVGTTQVHGVRAFTCPCGCVWADSVTRIHTPEAA